MKNVIHGILTLFFVFTSCEKEEYTTSEFFLKNNCDFTIDVYSSVIKRYSDGPIEVSLDDVLASGDEILMRRIKVSESFSINSVFSKLEIYKGSTKSLYDVMDKENWQKRIISDDKIEYTLTVDTTFFND